MQDVLIDLTWRLSQKIIEVSPGGKAFTRLPYNI
jgi:hypothetical protein